MERVQKVGEMRKANFLPSLLPLVHFFLSPNFYITETRHGNIWYAGNIWKTLQGHVYVLVKLRRRRDCGERKYH